MTEKRDSDYYRRQDKLEEYKLIPLAIYAVAVMATAYYLSFNDYIAIGESELYGLSKYLWVLSVEVFYGFGLLFGASSLVFIFWVGAMTKYGGHVLHPWRPIVTSGTMLVVCFLFLMAGSVCENYIISNVHEISGLSYYIDYEILKVVGWFAWFLVACWLANFIGGVLYSLIRAPFNAGEHLEMMREAKRKQSRNK